MTSLVFLLRLQLVLLKLTHFLFVLWEGDLIETSLLQKLTYVELVSKWEPAYAGAATSFRGEPPGN